jgi:DNA processing protein
MPPAPESAALVALLRLGSRPWHSYADAIEEAGSTVAVLESELSGSTGSQTSLLLEDPRPLLAQAADDIARWQASGMHLITVLDDDYPHNLRGVHDRPPLIFTAGALAAADTRSVAVIGSRRATDAGTRAARALAEHLVQSGFTVVSGLASGIDTAAHEAALKAGGRTVAVIGTGLARTYPPENAHLQRRIAACGAVVSQFWPDASPSRHSFPQRNATMSGLALGTVIVEASVRSGARIQARLALAHGRPVFLLRPLLAEEWGQQLAQRPGAYVFDEPAEITAAIDRLTDPGTLVG